jgi:hypothetical protein
MRPIRRLEIIELVACHNFSRNAGKESYHYTPWLSGQYQGMVDQQKQAEAGRQGTEGQLLSGYGAMANSQGYTPQEQQALNVQGMEGVASGYGAARDQAANRMARTGNSAGYYAGNAAMGAGQARALGEQARQNQLANMQFKYAQQAQGLQGLGGVYQNQSQYLNNLLGLTSGLSALRTSGAMGSTQYGLEYG